MSVTIARSWSAREGGVLGSPRTDLPGVLAVVICARPSLGRSAAAHRGDAVAITVIATVWILDVVIASATMRLVGVSSLWRPRRRRCQGRPDVCGRSVAAQSNRW